MTYRRLGRSGLHVSPLCLGTMMFGDRADEAAAREIVALARDADINFVDTADAYVDGESERIVGRAIAAERQRWVVATKVGNPMGILSGNATPDPNRRGLGRKWLTSAIDESLRRLGTDHVDIYYLHREDHGTPLEETVAALGDLIRWGKIRYFGVSNFRAWRIAEVVNLCRDAGIAPPVVCQPYYNAMNRMPEVEVLPACGHYGIGVASYSPIARGVLAGKYRPGEAAPADSRAGRNDKRIMQTEWRDESLRLAQRIREFAESRGMTAAQFAVNWVLNNALVTSAIVGPRTVEQMREYVGALAHRFEPVDEALIDPLVAPGHPSTPGYNDPAYPLEGRVPRTAAAR
ncbi:MAG TPA: aldo/keto reductase [Burkholderiaceae bacterium]|nr:aldo/keto reductase [Burkholderiaceae bacterium]